MDQIRITGIRAYGYMGALPEEQVLGQWFEVNLILWLDLSAAGASDRLSDTVDYGAVTLQVQDLLKTARFALLERLATAIAEMLLFPSDSSQTVPIQQVQVAVTKLTAPIPNFTGHVTVEITRNRNPTGNA
ncbi:dihydroneopterin aldolase [Leptodesmis sp.]|uniref:dihydroneopterin aldolase n=1 Tax=Leptodesmis sp. TaxID=3100501 RepID=UPI0040535320